MEAMLARGSVIPNFTLPDVAGQAMRRSQYRGREHVAVVFLRSAHDPGQQVYVQALIAEYAAIREAGGMLLLVFGAEHAAQAIEAALQPPFRLLIDAEGFVAARFMPPAAQAAVFVADRYAELYYSALANTASALPPASDIRAWLEAIDRQCVI